MNFFLCNHLCYWLKSSVLIDLIQATNETNVNIPQMADTLFERATNSSWVVVFKALVTTHHLMVHGNEVKLVDLSILFLAGEGDW